MRIKNNMRTQVDHQQYQVVWFSDLKCRAEFRLETNVEQMTNEEVGEVYRHQSRLKCYGSFSRYT